MRARVRAAYENSVVALVENQRAATIYFIVITALSLIITPVALAVATMNDPGNSPISVTVTQSDLQMESGETSIGVSGAGINVLIAGDHPVGESLTVYRPNVDDGEPIYGFESSMPGLAITLGMGFVLGAGFAFVLAVISAFAVDHLYKRIMKRREHANHIIDVALS